MPLFGSKKCRQCGRPLDKYRTRDGVRIETCLNPDCVGYLMGCEPECSACDTAMEYDNQDHEFVCVNPNCSRYLKSPD